MDNHARFLKGGNDAEFRGVGKRGVEQHALGGVTNRRAAGLAVEGALSPLETIAIIGISLRFTRTLEQLGSSFVGLDVTTVARHHDRLIFFF